MLSSFSTVHAPLMRAAPIMMAEAAPAVPITEVSGVVIPTGNMGGVTSWYDAGIRLTVDAAPPAAAPAVEPVAEIPDEPVEGIVKPTVEPAAAAAPAGAAEGLIWSEGFDPAALEDFKARGGSTFNFAAPKGTRAAAWNPKGLTPASIPFEPAAKVVDKLVVDEYLTVAPRWLDGSMAGDEGCDPLCLAALATPWQSDHDQLVKLLKSTEERRAKMLSDEAGAAEKAKAGVEWMRRAEIKHGRLAMLAAAGWPLSELLSHGLLVAAGTNGRAPSLFNGHLLDLPFAPFVLLAFGGFAYFEQETAGPEGPAISDYGFDPLGLSTGNFPEFVPAEVQTALQKLPNVGDKQAMELAELKNGRAAMMAITGFAVQEALWGVPVVDAPISAWFFGR